MDKVPLERLQFGKPLQDKLVDMLVYIARQVHIQKDKEVFRKNGNSKEVNAIVAILESGDEVDHGDYSLYTLASVVKRFLKDLPDGIFISTIEKQLLSVRKIENRINQHERINSIITSLQTEVQQLLALLFGTWFVIVLQSDRDNAAEAVAKSVAGSLFRTCADHGSKIEKEAVPVLKIMIDDFGMTRMFGAKNINYFTDTAQIQLNITVRDPLSPMQLQDNTSIHQSANLQSMKKIEERLQKEMVDKKNQFLAPVV